MTFSTGHWKALKCRHVKNILAFYSQSGIIKPYVKVMMGRVGATEP